MKRKIVLLIAGLGILASCNKDDDNNGSSSGSIEGTYKLTAFNISEAQDLNGDGTASINQMSETACFNESYLTLNANNTFTYDDKGVEINWETETETIGCYDDGNVTGTWSRSGNVLTLSYSSGGFTYQDEYTVSGSTISIAIPDGDAVGTAEGGEPVYVTADISAVYTKQ